jgi:hypothetical protein
MGAEFYFYTTPYTGTPLEALKRLRSEVFAKGEFNGAELNPASPEEALELTTPDGTRSILDISIIADTPDFFTASPFTDEELEDYFGSMKPPTADLRKRCGAAADSIDRGTARYLVAYDAEGNPSQYVFMGYSFD